MVSRFGERVSRSQGRGQDQKTKMVKIMRWVTDQYNVHKRMTTISDEELEQQIREHLPDAYMDWMRKGK